MMNSMKSEDGISQIRIRKDGSWNHDDDENFKVILSYEDGHQEVAYDGDFVTITKAKSFVKRKRLWYKDFCTSVSIEWWNPESDDIVEVIVKEMIPEVLRVNRMLKGIV